MDNQNLENNVPVTEATEPEVVAQAEAPVAEEAVVETPAVEEAPVAEETLAEVAPEAEEILVEEPTVEAPADKFEKMKNTAIVFAKDAFEKGKVLFDKFIAAFKADPKKMGIRVGAIALAVIVFFVGLGVVINLLTNNYKTPLKIMEKYANKKTYYNNIEMKIDLANGFCEDELKAYYKLYKSTDDYKDELEDDKEDFKDMIADNKEEYGSNYKITYKILDKEKIDKDDLKEIREQFRDSADALDERIEETEDFDSDDWEDLADSLGFDGNKSKAKKYISIVKDVQKIYKKAKVSDGYKLTVEETIKGKALDEPLTEEHTLYVYKINGRWVSLQGIMF